MGDDVSEEVGGRVVLVGDGGGFGEGMGQRWFLLQALFF